MKWSECVLANARWRHERSPALFEQLSGAIPGCLKLIARTDNEERRAQAALEAEAAEAAERAN